MKNPTGKVWKGQAVTDGRGRHLLGRPRGQYPHDDHRFGLGARRRPEHRRLTGTPYDEAPHPN